MRLLLCTGRLGYGGAERQTVLLASHLADRGHRVTVAPLFAGGACWDELERADVERAALAADRGGSPPVTLGRLAAAPRALRRLVARQRPEAVLGVLEIPNLVAALAAGRGGPPVVWSLRNSGPTGWKVRAADRWCVALSRRVPLVISNSHAGRAAAEERGYRPRNWTVVPNGFDTSLFRPDRAAGEALRAQWLDGVAGPLVGLVGRFDPRKGHEIFLAAAARVVAHRPGARFVFIGGGRTPATGLAALAESLGLGGRVVWAGEQTDMVAAYGALDLVVSASTSEGLSNILGEALACGVPCLATDVGDSALVVDDPARVVPPGDAAALAGAVLSHLEGDPAVPDLRLREVVERRFGVETMVTATEQALADVVSAAKGDAP